MDTAGDQACSHKHETSIPPISSGVKALREPQVLSSFLAGGQGAGIPAILNMKIRFSDAAPCPVQSLVIVNKPVHLDAPGWGSWGGRFCSARRASIIVMLAAVPDGAFIEFPSWQTIFGPILDDKLRL